VHVVEQVASEVFIPLTVGGGWHQYPCLCAHHA
jgi:imidazole glycerol phosphate synthase subunit HisF